MLLSDGYLANGSEPWRIPDLDELPAIDPSVRHRAEPHGHQRGRHRDVGVLALPARRRHAGPPLGDPGHPRPRAPHRRPREGRRPRQHLLRPGQPRLHGPHPAGQGRPDRRLAPAARGRRPGAGARRKVLVLGWGSTYGPIGAGVAASARPATTSPRRTCATSTRSRTTSATSCARYDKVLVPEMNLGQLSLLLRGKYLVDVVGYNQVRGLPLKAADARRRDRRTGRRGRGHRRRPHARQREQR